MSDTLSHIDATMDERLVQVFEFFRIPFISADPGYASDDARGLGG